MTFAVAAAWLVTAGSQDVDTPTRLRITNACASEPIWIAHEAGPSVGPDAQNAIIEPMSSRNFVTSNGLSATRYWGKMLCDERGDNCALGGSGGPGEACVITLSSGQKDYSTCAPPIDTKFEATFGKEGKPCDPTTGQMEGCDYVDVSLVDGFTLPFSLQVMGQCMGNGDVEVEMIDCSGLTFDLCPTAERLIMSDLTADLKAVNPSTGEVAGCYSPCTKLIDGKWGNELSSGRRPQDSEVAPYCCPTPPESPEACRAGPIKDTEFVQAVHTSCPGVYGYAYDDAMGLLRCNSATKYDLTFYCPSPMVHLHPAPRSSGTGGAIGFALFAALTVGATFLALLWRQQGWQLSYEQLPTLEDRELWRQRVGEVHQSLGEGWNRLREASTSRAADLQGFVRNLHTAGSGDGSVPRVSRLGPQHAMPTGIE